MLDRFDLAIDAYKAAQETDPLSASIIFNLVIAYIDSSQLDKAVAQLEIGRSMFAGEPLADILAASIALRRGIPEEALSLTENTPGSYGAWVRAMAYIDLNRPARRRFRIATNRIIRRTGGRVHSGGHLCIPWRRRFCF